MLGQYQSSENITKENIKIKVLGIGGGGNNAVSQMMNSNIKGAEYYLLNTDKEILDRLDNDKCYTIQIGKELTRGRGAGANPEIGEKAARESIDLIDRAIDGADLLFLTAGLGGGTGTGAISVIAEEAKKKGIITVAIVTTPFAFEGKIRTVRALRGLEKLKPFINSLIVISNDRLLANSDADSSILSAFKKTDDVLRQAVEAITDLIYSVGTINVDFADVQTILSYQGYAYMGIGETSGEEDDKVIRATKQALSNPLTITSIDDARGVIFNIKGSDEIGLDDINKAAALISEKVNSEANIIFGTEINEELGDKVVVTVIATRVNPVKETEPNKIEEANDNKGISFTNSKYF